MITSFRYWLAEIISDGALTEWRISQHKWHRAFQLSDAQARDATKRAHELQYDLNAATAALRTIAAMETPKAAHAAKRMAAVAQEALK